MASETAYWFDDRSATAAVRFFERILHHTKGEWGGKPFVLAPWQKDDVIRPLFGWKRPDGTRRYRKLYLEVPRKNGKALDVETPVLTTEGWKKHGDLRPGDSVFAPNGKPVSVLAVTSPYMGPCIALGFSDGEIIYAHERHEWATNRTWYTGRKRGSRGAMPFVETRMIAETLKCGVRGDFVHRVPVTEPLQCAEKVLPVPPYTLGAWLGDGNTDQARVTSADPEIPARIALDGFEVRKKKHYLWSIIGLLVKLRAAGVLGDKHIPEAYFTASHTQRLELLRGLLDTDGHVTKRGQIEFVSIYARLAQDFIVLARTLGLKPTCTIDRARLNGKDCGARYRVQLFARRDSLLGLKRKADLQRYSTGRALSRTIVSADSCGERLCNCIGVDGGMYLAGHGLIPTHNSTLSAAIALYMLFADLGPDNRAEPVAEIYSAAADREQAAIVFEEAKRMVEDSPVLKREAEIYRRSIVVPRTRSSYKVLSADAFTKHGLNAHAVIFDELHAQPTPDLWEVLKTSFGSRRQPLMVEITTAGYDRESICWREHEEARRVIEGLESKDDLLPLIYGAAEQDDWTDPAIWAKANPNLGISIKGNYLQSESDAARLTPAYQNTFRRLHLNQWTQQVTRWLPMEQWQACGEMAVDEFELVGRTCYAGLDLASTTDLAAFVMVFPPEDENEPYQLLCRFWCPAENIVERARRDRVPYDAWARDGLIKATEGNVIDYATIAADIEALNERYRIAEIAFDRWGAVQMSQQLDGAGLQMLPFGQGFASMSAPAKEFLRLILDGKLAHGGNPVLRWMADNVAVRQDPAGNVKPDKAKSTGRIDGIVAGIMAIDRATRHGASVYESRGILVL